MFAAQERRRSKQELIERTPADGLVGGVGDDRRRSGRRSMSYDYTVLAGTQGMRNHQKKDRLFEVAERRRLPVVLFAEGGGGRPGDVDMPIVAGLDCRAFHLFARLSGLVPLVGIASGYCFAGNAALLGLLRRGHRHRGLEHRDGRAGDDRGRRPRLLRPERGRARSTSSTPTASSTCGSRDDAEAVAAAKRYLSYFRGSDRAGPAQRPDARCAT